MDSSIENNEDNAGVSAEQPEENFEGSGEEITTDTVEETGEIAVENENIGDRNSEEKLNPEVSSYTEIEKAEQSMDKEGIEIVEIEEKVTIETLDEAKDAEESVEELQDTSGAISGNTDDSADLPSSEGTSTQPDTTEPQEEESKQDEWLDLLGNGLLKKKIIKSGKEDSSRPLAGQEVCIKCEGALPDGDKVDVRDDLKFIIGDGDVITALDLCVPTMLLSEICVVVAAPRFAYGTIGRKKDGDMSILQEYIAGIEEDVDEGDVPPECEVTYTLELLSVEKGPDISNLTDEERTRFGDEKRERGNDLFRREEYSLAIHSYTRALKYLGSSTAEAITQLKIKCWNNISASHLKLQDYVPAKKACDSVLEVDPDNVKALFRKGKVLHHEKEYEESVELLKKANALDPENRLIRKELHIVRQKCGESRQKERSMYQRMVSGHNNKDTTSGDNNAFFTWPVILGITGVALGGVVIAAVLLSRH